MEDYKKKYEDALSRARQVHTTNVDENKKSTEYIFPELKENEDERIRKALISFFQRFPYDNIEKVGTNPKEAITWLEKPKYTKKDVDDAWLEGIASAKKELEKQDEPTNWTEEDERLCQCLINDQEESLKDVRNDRYGHAEIISDLKEMYRKRINWLKSIKERLQ